MGSLLYSVLLWYVYAAVNRVHGYTELCFRWLHL